MNKTVFIHKNFGNDQLKATWLKPHNYVYVIEAKENWHWHWHLYYCSLNPMQHICHACNEEFIQEKNLNDKQVLEIRKLSRLGLSLQNIAKIFDVSKATILRIVNNQNWRHI